MNNLKRKFLLRQPIYDFLNMSGKLPELVNLVDITKAIKLVVKDRPQSNELIDQCPIADDDLVQRVKLIYNYLHPSKEIKILFVGDDDLTSAVIGKTSQLALTVIDIDKKILSTIKKHSKKNLANLINANILDIVDGNVEDPLSGKFDTFVTDPPYTEMGYKYFLNYGIKHIKMGGLAFIAIPYMNMENWTDELLFKTEDFLLQNGFVIVEIIPGFAEYQHEDKVLSSMIVAKKVTISKKIKNNLKRTKTYTTNFEL